MTSEDSEMDLGMVNVMRRGYDFVGNEPLGRCHCKMPCIRERIKIQRWNTRELLGESTIMFQVNNAQQKKGVKCFAQTSTYMMNRL